MIIMFQGYLHEVIGGFVGIGPALRSDMLIHHFATMTLISSAYLLNLSRMGIMWQVSAAQGLHLFLFFLTISAASESFLHCSRKCSFLNAKHNDKPLLCVAQALFDISNPLLHTAKMMNTLGFKQVGVVLLLCVRACFKVPVLSVLFVLFHPHTDR